jgi:hypothetical protein
MKALNRHVEREFNPDRKDRPALGQAQAEKRPMIDEKLPPEPEWRVVSGLRIIIPHCRPDVMLVEIKTLYGPVRLSTPKSVALTVGRSITAEAEKLAPDGSLS